MEKYLNDLKQYAKINHIPIIKDDGCDFLIDFLKNKKPKNILEIGTAVGYSGVKMLNCVKDATLTTIEIDEHMAKIAKQTFEKTNLTNRVNLIQGDARQVIYSLKENSFDFIFLDGPKGQYINYYQQLKILLKSGGYIFVDNIYFHNLVNGPEFVKHKLRTIVVNLRKFIQLIQNDSQVNAQIYEMGDGLALIEKR